uniref:Putative vacuolar protein-sorting protein n=1 Tax=Ornithodoros turicata TaxID=34597 RepID=A0A2R5L9N5_9ACAR
MFKLESYVTPLILSYVNKYVKNIRPEDSQLSLWGGDAVFNNLDLRLDVLEQELNIPFSLVNGHIHELRIHVPWTKLTSEPVVITVNTIECVLRLRDGPTSSAASSSTSSSSKPRRVSRQLSSPDGSPPMSSPPPPGGYLGSLLRRILHNVTVVLNNVILKYAEDDLVLSLNIKAVELTSADSEWKPAFIELTPETPALRKLLWMHDVTVCLDKRDSSGKIEAYQDPLLYHCFLEGRIHLGYDSSTVIGSPPSVTRCHFYCQQLDFSLTDQQLPLFLRLLELCLALYYGQLSHARAATETVGLCGENVSSDVADTAEEESTSQGWGSWAWSMVPQILPAWEEGDEEQGDGTSDPTAGSGLDPGLMPYESTLCHFGCYVEKLTCIFKTTNRISTSRHSASRSTWRPLLSLQLHGVTTEMTVRGMTWLHFQLGVVGATVSPLEYCACGFDEGARIEPTYLRAGVASGTHVYNYLSSSLFDPMAPENRGLVREPEPQLDVHAEQLTELAMAERFPAFCLDYLYELQFPEDWCDSECEVDTSYLENSNWKEQALCRSVIGPFTVDITAGFVHRFQHLFETSSLPENRPSYMIDEPQPLPFPQPYPDEEHLESMANFVPTRTYRLTLLKPTLNLWPSMHSSADATYQSSIRSTKKRRSFDCSWDEEPSRVPVLSAYLECLDISLTRPMYPAKMSIISSVADNLYELPDLVKHHSFCHLTIKVFGFGADLISMPRVQPLVPQQPGCRTILLSPTDATLRRAWAACPCFLEHHPRRIRMRTDADLGFLHIKGSRQTVMAALSIALSWSDGPHIKIAALPLVGNVPNEANSSLEAIVSGLKWSHTEDGVLAAHTVKVGSLALKLHDRGLSSYLIHAPEDTSEVVHFSKIESLTVNNTCEESWLEATLQVSRHWNLPNSRPNFIQLRVRGLALNFDPTLEVWLSDLPKVTPAYMKLPSDYFSSMKNESGTHSLSDELSGSSLSGSQKTRQLSESHATSPLPQSLFSPMVKKFSTCPGSEPEPVPPWTNNFRSLLFGTYHHLRTFSVQVYVGGISLLFPKTPRLLEVQETDDDCNASILRCWKELAQLSLNCQVSCALLPAVTIMSSGSKAMWSVNPSSLPLAELPDSSAGEKFPWSVQLSSVAAFETKGPHVLYALKPSSLSCTVALSLGETSEGASQGCTGPQLRLCVHLDVDPFHLSFSKKQVDNVGNVVRHFFALHHRLLEAMAWFNRNPPKQQVAPTANISSEKVKRVSRTLSQTESEEPNASSSVSPPPSAECSNVALSLWMQWTLPKFGLNLFGKEKCLTSQDIWVQLEVEEVTASLDIQEIYSKAKLKLASFNISCFEKSASESSSSWVPGPYEGVVLSSSDKLTCHTLVLGASRTANKVAVASPGNKGKVTEFLNFTWTRALQAHVRRNIHKSRKDFTPLSEAERRTHLSSSVASASYLSEVDLQMSPLDIVARASIISLLLDISRPVSEVCQLLSPIFSPDKEVDHSSAQPVGWNINSGSLPLCYLRTGTIRVFLPQSKADLVDSSWQGLDTCLVRIGSVLLSPQVENPLSRRILREDLFSWAQEHRLLATLGSNVEDRQYQLDLSDFSVCALTWSDMLMEAQAAAATGHPCTVLMGENPAFEWNRQPSGVVTGASQRPVPLTPISSSCDLRAILAPAIIAPDGDSAKKALVCAHSIEASIACDLHCYLSLEQLYLLLRVTSEITLALKDPQLTSLHSAHNDHPSTSSVLDMRDSGLDSDLSLSAAVSSSLGHHKLPVEPIQHGSVPQSPNVCFAPFDVLLTARMVSLTLGSVEKALSEQESSDFTSKVRDHSSSVLSDDDDDDLGYDASVDSDTRTEAAQTNQAQSSTYRRPKLVPLARMVLSHPHAFLSCSPQEQKVEVSCFDLQVSGSPPGAVVQGSCLASIESGAIFSLPWLETRPGEPDLKTGIPPSFFTVSIQDFLADLVHATVKVERPFKVNLSKEVLKQAMTFVHQVFQQVLPQLEHFIAAHPNSTTKMKSAPDSWRLVTTVETVQAVLALDVPFVEGDPAKLVLTSDGHSTKICMGYAHLSTLDTLRVETMLKALQLYASIKMERCDLLGPTTVTLIKDTFWDLRDSTTVPHCMLRLHFDALPLSVGPLQLQCCQTAVEHVLQIADMVSEFVENFPPGVVVHSTSDKQTASMRTSPAECTGVTWHDDLRKGSFQYIQDYGFPNPNEIVFCRPSEGNPGMMTWRYLEPRVLTRVDVYPVPFSTSQGDGISAAGEPPRQLECDLQFWDPCQERFITYQRFALSECTPHSLQLPQASRGSEHLLVVSDTWRVVLLPSQTSQGNAHCDPLVTVSPLALAACMRVDSHFDPCLVPLLRANVTVEFCKVMFNVPAMPPVAQPAFRPFVLDKPPYKCLGVMSVTLEKLSLSHTGWHYKMNMEACASVSSEVTELLYLTSVPFLCPVDVQATVDMCYQLGQEQHAEVSVVVDRCFLKLSQSIAHSVSTATALWKKDANCAVPAYIVICNDIQEDIRFGQVERDESITVQPGHAYAYTWRSHKRPRLLRFSMESQAWKWSTPFSPHGRRHNDQHVIQISRRLSTVGLCIRIKRNQGVETQVIVSGQLMLRSHLIDRLRIRFQVAEEELHQPGSVSSSSPHQKTYVGVVPTSHNCSMGTSLLVNPSSVHQISIQRETNQGWSAKIDVQKFDKSGDWAEIVEIPDMSIIGGVLRAWCYTFKKTDECGGSSLVLAFAPLYILRSHLPYSLLVHLNKHGAGDDGRETLQVQGRGQDHFLSASSPSTTAITFQLGPDMKVSSPPVHLDPPSLPVPFAAPAEIVSMLWDPSWPITSHPDPLKWPYHNTEVNEEVNGLWESGLLVTHCTEKTSLQGPSEVPETELKVVQFRDPRSPFLGTVVVDVKPWAFLVNECGCSLHLLTGNQGSWVLLDGQVFTPPVLHGPFHLAVEEFGTLWKFESPLRISAELLRKIVKLDRPPKATMGVSELAVGEPTSINIAVGEGDTKKACRLVVDTNDMDGCLIISIRSAVYIVSHIQMPLNVGTFAVPGDTPYMEQWTGRSPILSKVSLPSMCNEKDKHSIALLKWELMNVDQGFFDTTTKYETWKLFLTISQENAEESLWSLPIMLAAVSSSDERHTTAVPTRCNAPYTTIPLVLTTHKRSGVLYIIVHHDNNPLLRISNATNVNLQFAEASDEDGSTLQPFLSSLPSGCCTYFTPPRLNRRCSQGLGQDTQCPTLYFAHLEESSSTEGDNNFWSSPITCASDAVNQFVRIPNLGDVRVSARKVGHTTDLLVESVSRAEISAKEIRSRIGASSAVKLGKLSDHSASKMIVTKQTPEVLPRNLQRNAEDTDAGTILRFLENCEKTEMPSWARILDFASLKFHHACIVLSDDDMESDNLVGPVEILRLIVDDMSWVLRHSSTHSDIPHFGVKYELFVFVGNFQLDNQLAGNAEQGVFDFPVVVTPQGAAASMHAPCQHDSAAVFFTMMLDVLPHNNISPQSMLLKLQPLDVFLEDGLLYRAMEMWTFFRLTSPAPRQQVLCGHHLPSEVFLASVTLVQTVHVREVTIESVALRLSVHASLKLFLSLNGTPLSFAKFSKTCLVVTWYQLGQLLTRHYVTGALFRAGWVVGSLDLLGNPAGLLQAISSGVSALVVLPFRGLAQGRPMAFLLGVTHGTTAMLRHISSGALSSVTHLATSVSRNLDRMTLDSDHLAWKEALRSSSSQGFAQGLTTLGLSLLGAIAGIVDHPMRALISEDERSPTGFVKGVGKGLIGVVAKPIGGAAELVAQTGKGILRGAGWGICAHQRYTAETHAYKDRSNSDAKLRARLGSSQLLLAVQARHIFDGERSQIVILVLTTECLSIFSEEEDSLERSFSVAEVTCVVSATDPSVLILGLESQSETLEEEPATRARVRVAEYVTKASQFASYNAHEHSSTVSSESFLGVTYRFSIDPKLRTLFLARLNEAKRVALGKGFGFL